MKKDPPPAQLVHEHTTEDRPVNRPSPVVAPPQTLIAMPRRSAGGTCG